MRSGPETLLTNPGLIAKVLIHRAKRTLQKPSASQAGKVHLFLLLLLLTCSFETCRFPTHEMAVPPAS